MEVYFEIAEEGTTSKSKFRKNQGRYLNFSPALGLIHSHLVLSLLSLNSELFQSWQLTWHAEFSLKFRAKWCMYSSSRTCFAFLNSKGKFPEKDINTKRTFLLYIFLCSCIHEQYYDLLPQNFSNHSVESNHFEYFISIFCRKCNIINCF